MPHLSSHHPANNLFRYTFAALITFSILLSGCVTGKAPETLPYLREQGDFFMQAGIESYTRYNFSLANEQFIQAKNFYSRFDDYLGTTHAILNLAQVHIASGRFHIAMEYLTKADVLIQQHKLEQPAIYHDVLLTNLYLATDRLADAEAVFVSYDHLLRGEIADDTTLALLVNRVRLAQLSSKDFSVWLDLLARQADKHNSAELALRRQRFKAWQAFHAGDSGMGNQLFSAALDSYRKQANPSGLMSTQLEWAQSCEKNSNWTLATEHYQQALYLAMANNHSHNGLRALEGLRSVYQQTKALDKLPQIDEWEKQLKSIPGDALAP
jgi:tetratricopeptide (TPR) repeat protein